MARAAAEQMIFMIIIGLILVGFFVWAIISNFGGIRTAAERQLGTARRMVADFTGSGDCPGLPTSCKRWVYDGLGLYISYDESGVYGTAQDCNVLESVCPSASGSRIGVKDCLEMCVDLLKCDDNSQDQGFDSVLDCYTSVVSNYRGS